MKPAEAERWNRARALLDHILEEPGAGTVAGARASAANSGCETQLEALLKALDTVSVLDAPLDDAISEIAAASLRHGALSGRVFGRWTLGEEIGRGGMSTVYLARRSGDGFEQQAALKILSLTFASQGLVDSFLRERQILSELQHPGIARLIDGGVTPEGSPFLVMDYVDGLRIDQWCTNQGADAAAIVRLMLALALAVAHAQRLLVIHRDINASNVLVNRRGEPVLIDFGIAGLLNSDSGQTLHAFTPTFAAPEQIAGVHCTTATDVYAIGRLLQSLLPAGTADSDLKLLISTATATDPERRYANARSLAEDLQAWLEKRPLRARPPNIRYRMARFVARHRFGVAAGMLALLAVLGGFTTSLWQAHIAATERDLAQSQSARATQVTEFLKDLFRASEPDQARGEAVTARELLDQGAYQARTAFEGTPELKVEMLVLLGDLYRELDELEAAEPLLQDALALAQSQNDTPQIVDALTALAILKMSSQDHEGALLLAQQAEDLLQVADAIPGHQHSMLLRPMLFSLAELGRIDEAVERGGAALENARRHPELPALALYRYLYEFATALNIAQRDAEAEPLLLEAMNLEKASINNPTTQIALLSSLASVADSKGDIAAAIGYQRQAIELSDLIYPPTHSVRARLLNNLAVGLNSIGNYPEAEKALQEALDIYASKYGDEAHPRVAAAHNNLGRALSVQGKYQDAATHMALARTMAGELFGHNDPRYASATVNLGDLQRRAGRLDEAEELLILNLELRRSILGPEHRMVGNGLAVLALLRLDQGRYEEALSLCDEALALFAHIGFEQPLSLILTRVRRARALAALGRADEAGAEFTDLLRLTEEVGADVGAARLDLLAAHAEFLLQRAHPDADKAIHAALDAHTEALGPIHPDTQRLAALSQAQISD